MSARIIDTSINIGAEPDAVWRILMDFQAYSDWNPFVYKVDGEAVPGERLTVLIQPPGKLEMEFRPHVQTVVKEREFSWLGHFLVPGLFDGRHEFLLEPLDEGESTRFHHRETFSGLLVPLLWGRIRPPTQAGFEYMNRALKLRAESFRND